MPIFEIQGPDGKTYQVEAPGTQNTRIELDDLRARFEREFGSRLS